jgi:hypothetical protein
VEHAWTRCRSSVRIGIHIMLSMDRRPTRRTAVYRPPRTCMLVQALDDRNGSPLLAGRRRELERRACGDRICWEASRFVKVGLGTTEIPTSRAYVLGKRSPAMENAPGTVAPVGYPATCLQY